MDNEVVGTLGNRGIRTHTHEGELLPGGFA